MHFIGSRFRLEFRGVCYIWEEILPHPSESMSRTLKDLERQACTVFWEMIRLSH